MILVDTSIWVDFFRAGEPLLAELLSNETILIHPFVVGELAVGNLPRRTATLHYLHRLTPAVSASDDEVLGFIMRHGLHGIGIGYVDCHLLASVRLTPGASIWARDRRLMDVAVRLGLAVSFPDGRN